MRGIALHCRKLEYTDKRKSTWPRGCFNTSFGSDSFTESVVVFVCIENGDTKKYVDSAVERVLMLNKQFWKCKHFVITPFAHLSNNLARANEAVFLLDYFKESLQREGCIVGTVSFGTDKDFLIDVFGHRAAVSYFEFPFSSKSVSMNRSSNKFEWDPLLYNTLVNESNDTTLWNSHRHELGIIGSIASQDKTLVEIGEGTGRILKHSSDSFGSVVAIEFDDNMYSYLCGKYGDSSNIKLVHSDATSISKILPRTNKPVVTCLQNTLGTITGDWHHTLSEIIAVSKERRGELVLSLFRRKALAGWGLKLYQSLEELVGEYDPENSNLATGDFVTKTGYHSHWWGKAERAAIKQQLAGAKTSITATDEYWIIHADFSN